jgi:hypothetical protein
MTATKKRYSYPRVALIQIDVHITREPEAWTFTNNHHRYHQKEDKWRNLHTKSYKVKLERLYSARLTHRDQAVRLLDMQRLQVVNDT